MKAQEKRIAAEFKLEPDYERLLSLPGVGPTLGAVLAAKIDQIERFRSADKLAPDKTETSRLLRRCHGCSGAVICLLFRVTSGRLNQSQELVAQGGEISHRFL